MMTKTIWMAQVITGMLLLIPLGIRDLKKRSVPVWGILVGFLVSACMTGWFLQMQLTSWSGVAMALLPGMFLLLVAWLTGGKVGYGDGLCMLFIGEICGVWVGAEVMILSILESAAICGFLWITRRVQKNTRIPFLPFVAISFCAVMARSYFTYFR